MASLLKTEYCNLPLSVPVEMRNFFQEIADELGISRNAAMQLALRIGAPVTKEVVKVVRRAVRSGCLDVSKGMDARLFSKILGAAGKPRPRGKPRS